MILFWNKIIWSYLHIQGYKVELDNTSNNVATQKLHSIDEDNIHIYVHMNVFHILLCIKRIHLIFKSKIFRKIHSFRNELHSPHCVLPKWTWIHSNSPIVTNATIYVFTNVRVKILDALKRSYPEDTNLIKMKVFATLFQPHRHRLDCV